MIFDFNSSERKGLLVLAVLIILSIAFRYALPFIKSSSETDFTEFKKDIEAFSQSQKEYDIKVEQERLEKQNKYKNYKNNNYQNNYKYKKNTRTIKYFNLDPNIARVSDWERFGFSKKQSYVIFNYINKRGGISKKEQLKEIFVIDNKKYNEMKSFILIDKTSINNKQKSNFNSNKVEHVIVEINSATKDELMSISGIGSVFSDRIIKYRDLLGGFYSVEQLNNVYGIKPETFELIKDNIIVEKELVNKFNVNFVDAKELSSHPLISYKEAKALINYRTNKGFINDLNVLFDNDIIKNKDVKHYLKAND